MSGPAEPGRRRGLGRLLAPRASRGQLLAAVLCALLGFALVAQVNQAAETDLSGLRESDLVRILGDVTERSERLEEEAARLERTRAELATGSDQAEAAREAARERVELLGILAGTLPAVGPGIRLTIADPDGTVPARVLLDAVQELRNAGAEAMQVGDVRVVASTAFVDGPDGVEADGTVLERPYVFQVIGDPKTLSTALAIPGGVLVAVRSSGGTATVTELPEVRVDALRQVSAPEYARPAEPAEPTSGP